MQRVALPVTKGGGWSSPPGKPRAQADRGGAARSERRFREVVESLPQLVWTCRADGPCDYLSRSGSATPASRKRPSSVRLAGAAPPEDRDRTVAAWRATAALGRRSRSSSGFAVTMARIAGSHAGGPLRDDAGNVVKWFGSNTDIQDLKEAERAVRASETRLRQALEAVRSSLSSGIRSPMWCTAPQLRFHPGLGERRDPRHGGSVLRGHPSGRPGRLCAHGLAPDPQQPAYVATTAICGATTGVRSCWRRPRARSSMTRAE